MGKYVLFTSLVTSREMKGEKMEEKERPEPSGYWVDLGQTADATKLFQDPLRSHPNL